MQGLSKEQTEEAAVRLAHENSRLKLRNNDDEARIKRLQTQIHKIEKEISELERRAGAKAKYTKARSAVDPEVEKLEAVVREKERGLEVLERQILLVKHTLPADKRGTPQRAVPWAAGVKGRGPAKSAAGLVNSTSDEERQRIILALQGELSKAIERFHELKAAAANAIAVSQVTSKEQKEMAKSAVEPLVEVQRRIKETSARLTILHHTQQQVQESYDREVSQHEELLEEYDSLARQRDEHRAKSSELSQKAKQLEIQAGRSAEDKGGASPHVEQYKLSPDVDPHKLPEEFVKLALPTQLAVLKEHLGKMEEDNSKLRSAAFSAGTGIVEAKEREGQKEQLQAQHKDLKQEVEGIGETIQTLQTKLDKVLAGEGSVDFNRRAVEALDTQHQKLQRESDLLRERLAALNVQVQGEMMEKEDGKQWLSIGGRGGGGSELEMRLRREIRRLRAENAAEVREMDKGMQMGALQDAIISEAAALEVGMARQLERLKRSHARKQSVLHRRLNAVHSHNERLRGQLAVQQGGAGAAQPDEQGGAVSLSAPAPAEATSNVVSVTVEGLELLRSYGDFDKSEPHTLLVLDFFMHDTQHSPPALGLRPRTSLARRFDVTADMLFLHYLYTDGLHIQLLRVRGLEASPLASAHIPLRGLIDVPGTDRLHLHKAELKDDTDAAGNLAGVVAHANVTVSLQKSIAEQARAYLAQWGGIAPERLSAEGGDPNLQVYEAFARQVGATYTLVVHVQSVAGVRAGMQAFAMFQLLDFQVSETDVVAASEGGAATFSRGRLSFPVPASASSDKRLLSHLLEVCIFDDAAPDAAAFAAVGSVLLAPLISKRGFRATLPLQVEEGAPAGKGPPAVVVVEVAWEREPLVKMVRTESQLKPRAGAAVLRVLWELKQWVEAQPHVGQPKQAYKALYEHMLDEASDADGGEAEGLTREAFVSSFRKVAPQFKHVVDTELEAVFDFLTAVSQSPSLSTLDFVNGLAGARRPPTTVHAGQEVAGGAGEMEDEEGDALEDAELEESEEIFPTADSR